MSKRKSYSSDLVKRLEDYASSRYLTINEYSPFHNRLSDDYTVIDIWTTYKYHILHTSYHEMTKKRITERDDEKGYLPRKNLEKFLDELFYAPDILEEDTI